MSEVLPTLECGIRRLTLDTKLSLSIAAIGCDHHEAVLLSDADKAKKELEQLLSTLSDSLTVLDLYIIGPDVPIELTTNRRVSPVSFQSNGKALVTIYFEHALFHESSFIDRTLDLVIAYNAGIWGYESWLKTLDLLFLGKHGGVKFIVTSYTLEESEDDYDKMVAYFDEATSKRKTQKLIWEWDCEKNPSGSKIDLNRKTKSTEGDQPLKSHYFASGFWQCLFSRKIITYTCSRCHTSYDPETNSESSCRYHPESYSGETAQRWMAPGETEGGGTIHNFFSCCADPDPKSEGCCATRHTSYDEPEDTAASWGRRPGMGI